jgi:hypothetical protein
MEGTVFRALKIALLVGFYGFSSFSVGQDCDSLKSGSTASAVDYLQHAGNDAAAARCVQVAFRQIGSSPPEQAIPLLVTYLGYKRPLNDGERHGIFMHGDGPAVLYPAVHELNPFGYAAEPALADFIGNSADGKGTEIDNAIYTLLLIHHGNALAVIEKLHKDSVSAASAETRDRLQRAARNALKWCDEAWQAKCEDALK